MTHIPLSKLNGRLFAHPSHAGMVCRVREMRVERDGRLYCDTVTTDGRYEQWMSADVMVRPVESRP